MVFTGAALVLMVGLQAASTSSGGGGGGGGGEGGRGAWQDDTIVFQDDQPWDGTSYAFAFQTLFGNIRKEKAELKETALGNKYLDVEGEYSYPMADGFVHRVTYRANNQGYRQSKPILTEHIMDNPENKIARFSKSNNDDAEGKMFQTNSGQPKNLDKIHFPTEESDIIRATTPNSILTSSLAVSATESTNGNSADYYDELGNRVGGIPPAVLGSLLG